MDERLRQLERDAAAGVAGARAAWLAERVRAGTLEPERLRLAAYVGDPDARAAVGEAFDLQAVGPWAQGLAAWGVEPWREERTLAAPGWRDELLPRAALALAAATCPADATKELAENVASVLEAPRRWLRRPSLTAAREARRRAGWAGLREMPGSMARLAALHVSPTGRRSSQLIRDARALLRHHSFTPPHPGELVGVMTQVARDALGEQPTRHTLRDALVPWLLV